MTLPPGTEVPSPRVHAAAPPDAREPAPVVRLLGHLFACLGAVLLAIGVPLLAAAPAHAAPGDATGTTPTLTVTMGSMSPSSLATGTPTSQRLTISGTLANTSSDSLTAVQVYLWRDTTPLSSNAQLSQYLTSDPATPTGRRALDAENGTYQTITTQAQPTFAPGQSASFTVSAQANLLGFTEPGVYPVGVQVRAMRPDGSVQTVGRARTTITVHAADASALKWSPVVMLTATPTLLNGSTFANDTLVDDLGGRLARLLDLAAQPGVSTLVDPALVDEVETLRGVHTVRGSVLTPAQQARQRRIAAQWLARLQQVLAQHRAWRLPWGNADLALGLQGDAEAASTRQEVADADTDAAAATQPVVAATARLPLVVVPTASSTSERLLSWVGALHPALVLADNADSGIDSGSGLPVQAARMDLRAGGPTPVPSSTDVQLRSLLLARAQLVTSARRAPLVVPVQTDADLGLVRLARGTLTATALAAPTQGTAVVPASAPVPAAQATITRLTTARQAYLLWGDVTGRASLAAVRQHAALARAMSQAFTTDAQRTAWIAAAVHELGDVAHDNLVVARMSNSFVLSGDQNVLPAAVTNHMSTGARVKMTFTSENPQRLTIDDTPVVTIAPGETATLHFRPRPSTNGVVTVLAQLRTPEGRPIGQPIRVSVRATSFGRVGWIIVLASGIAFMGLTTLRIRQVQRDRNRTRELRIAAGTEEVIRAARFPDVPPSGQTGTQQRAHGESGATDE